MTIRARILLFTVVLVAVAMLAAGMMGYKVGTTSLESGYSERLTQIRLSKAQALQTDFENLGNYLLVASEMNKVRNALLNLENTGPELEKAVAPLNQEKLANEVSSFYKDKPEFNFDNTVITRSQKVPLFLQAQFLKQAAKSGINPKNVISVKEFNHLKLFKIHEALHPFMIDYGDRFQVADILLIDRNGVVVYSLKKGLNFGSNLKTGIFNGSRLADIYNWSMTAAPRNYKFFDFGPLAAFYPENAAYLVTPIFENSKYLGTIAFQISLKRIDQVLSDNHQWKKLGLRETGEVVAYGADGLLRSNSRMYFENPVQFEQIYSESGNHQQALGEIQAAGTTAMHLGLPGDRIRHYLRNDDLIEKSPDYLNIPALKSIGKVHLPGGVEWVIVAKADLKEASGPLYDSYILFLVIAGFILFSALIASAFFVKRLTRPLKDLHKGLEGLSTLKSTEKIIYKHRDEYSQIFTDYNSLAEALDSALKEKRNLENMMSSLNEILFVVEPRHRQDADRERIIILSANSTAADLIGISEASLKGSDLSMWLETDLQALHDFLNIEELFDEKKQTEGFLKSITGEKIPLNLSWAKIKNTDGSNHLVVVGTDIRWKRDTERELKLQEGLLRASQALSKTGAFRWEMDSGRIIWSDEQYNLLGLDPMKAKPSFDLYRSLVHPEDLPILDRAMKDSQKSMEPFSVELRMRRVDTNEYVWMRTKGETEYDKYGNPISMWGINQDVTALKKAEQELISTKDEALKSSQAKSQFLAHMSHEIRTPMNAIMGMAELLKETPLNNDQKYYLTIFQKAGEVLMALINDILDLSKIEAGEVSIENIPFDMNRMMTDVQEIMRPRALEKGIDYSFEIGAGINTRLMGDPTKLRQVLINLVSNSIKFTERGQIKVSIVKNPTKKDNLMISVADTGVGIPGNKQHLIFQKFSQADSSITRRYGGTGLGLAISKSLVELMGGQIWFKSRENVGTTFFFTVPSREQTFSVVPTKPLMHAENLDFVNDSTIAPSKPIVPLAPGRKVRILVADDTEDNRILFLHYLKNGPYEIIEAENGLEAVDKIKSEEFDIVFMDVQMPEMDGYAATSIIRDWEKDTHHSHIPIIALTAHALSDDRQKSLRAGCDDHVTKPFKKDALIGVINRYSH